MFSQTFATTNFSLPVENSSLYWYGFNGKEKDNEVKNVEGSQLDFGARVYDSRLGRFLSVDPLASKFPFQSPYIFANNNPILMVDVEGEHGTVYIQVLSDENGQPAISKAEAEQIKTEMQNKYKEMGVEVTVEIHFENDVMTKHEFKSREGYDIADKYVVVGKAQQLNEKAVEAHTEGGWGQTYTSLTPKNSQSYPEKGTTVSEKDDVSISYVNIEAHNNYGMTSKSGRAEFLKDLTLSLYHEPGHSEFYGFPGNLNFDYSPSTTTGHILGTVMDFTPTEAKFTDEMIKRLQGNHNTYIPNDPSQQQNNNVPQSAPTYHAE